MSKTDNIPLLMLRSVIGGILMGLANLVPGISGGTMLLAAGIYPCFINAIAEVTTLRLRVATIAVLGSVVGAASVAILLFAGVVKELVVDHRWMMYSLFIGLTLGGKLLDVRVSTLPSRAGERVPVPAGWRLATAALTSDRGGTPHHKAPPLTRPSAIPRAGSRRQLNLIGPAHAQLPRSHSMIAGRTDWSPFSIA